MVALSFYRNFHTRENFFKSTCYNFFAIFSFELLPSSRFKLHVYFRLFCQAITIQKPSLTQKKNLHAKIVVPKLQETIIYGTRRVVLLVHCIVPTVPFSPENYKMIRSIMFVKKHSAPKPDVTFKCKLFYQEFPGFYALRQHRNTQHGMQIQSRTRDVDVEHIVGHVEDHRLREELRSCQYFLVDSELD